MNALRRRMTWLAGAAFLCSPSFALAGCQDAAPASAPSSCTFDPTGELAFAADGADYALRFPELRWPTVGSWLLPDKPVLGADKPVLCRRDGDALVPIGGVALEVTSFRPERVALRASWSEAGQSRSIQLDLPAVTERRTPPKVLGAIPGMEREAPSAGDPEDFVLLVLGSPGSRWRGQDLVARSVAKLAATDPPDQVVFLGDLLVPDGPKSPNATGWVEDLSERYARLLGTTPIPLVPGPAEHRGDMEVLYGLDPKSSPISVARWFRRVEATAAGTPVELLLADSITAAGSASRSEVRRARSLIAAALAEPASGWRVVASFDPVFSFGDAAAAERAQAFQLTHRPMLGRARPDLWISAASRSLELVRGEHGILHVGAGGGAGDELARDITWSERTLFAAARGGSVWIRLGKKNGEIVFRSETGDALHVHRFERNVR
ncbi:MAG: hypothetical protein AB7I19_04085 [Planctomycetota bacterium]